MAILKRTSDIATQEEIQIFAEFCLANNVNPDPANINVFADYMERWQVMVNHDSLTAALNKLTEAKALKIMSASEAKYQRAAEQAGPVKTQQLEQWITGTGNKSLIADGDRGFDNRTVLLNELTGREVSSAEIHNAIGRASRKTGVYFTPKKKEVDPRQHTDDGRSLIQKQDDNREYIGGKKNHAYKPAGTPEDPKKTTDTMDAWQHMCQQILLGSYSHSQQAALKELYDRGASRGYRDTYAEMSKLRSSYQRVGSYRGV